MATPQPVLTDSLPSGSFWFARAVIAAAVLGTGACGAGSQPAPSPPRPAPGPSQAQPSPKPEPAAEGKRGRFTAFERARALGVGINLGNALEAPTEGEWGVRLTEQDFQLAADAGFDHIRLPVRWSAHAGEQAPYAIDGPFAARVKWAVDTALGRGLRVVLTVHHYRELMKDPETHGPRLVALWEQISKRFAGYPDELCFELLNEPNGAMGARETNQILAEVIEAVRRDNPHRMLVVGPADWYKIARLDRLELPAHDEELIVTFHYYEPRAFTHQGAAWSNLPGQVGIDWPGPHGGTEEMGADFERAKRWSVARARPLYLGEFGAYEAAPVDARKRWTAAVARLARQHEIPYAYWELRAGFGAYDSVRKAWRKELLDAVLPGHRVPPEQLVFGQAATSAP
jgi:endoglucanase